MTLAVIIAVFLAVFFFFFKTHSGGKTLGNIALAENYQRLLEQQVKYFRNLNPEKKEKFVQQVIHFLHQTHIEGVGTEVRELDKVLVAASAIIPIFGFEGWKYHNLTNVILYPNTFNNEFQFEGNDRNVLGMVGSGYMNGQMILSKSALMEGFADEGAHHTAIHEFVHLLDKSDGSTDGIPENLLQYSYTIPWLKMMHEEIQRIERGESDINPYAVSNDAEFFAVVSEYFFKQPDLLERKHPEIYNMLSKIFLQDPAGQL